MSTYSSITLLDLLEAKEQRAIKQQNLLQVYNKPLISFTINYPGQIKDNAEVRQFFKLGCLAISTKFKTNSLIFEQQELLITGPQAFFIYDDIEVRSLKEKCIQLEQGNKSWCRLWDIDVFDADTLAALTRTKFAHSPRKCFICDQSAKECARSKAHSLSDIHSVITQCYKSSLS